MLKKIRIMRVRYPDIQVPQWQGRKLRGFFSSGQEQGSLLHNHGEGGKSMYRYPLVQYKVIRSVPNIIALGEGIREIYPLVMDREQLRLGEQNYPRGHMDIALSEEEIGGLAERRRYCFCSPWFGLNQDNYQRYKQMQQEEREELLRQVLIGNLLSMSKSLGITVEQRLFADMDLQGRAVSFKNENVLGFVGEFSVNYAIPPLVGIGKSVSRGFGSTRPVQSKADKKY